MTVNITAAKDVTAAQEPSPLPSKEQEAVGVQLEYKLALAAVGGDGTTAEDVMADQEPTPLPSKKEEAGLQLRYKLALAVGGDGSNMIYVIIEGFFLNAYLLETCCLDPATVAMIQLTKGLFDAFNDPIIGFLTDRTHSRWGRRRPWLLFGGPVFGLSYIALWNKLPQEAGATWKFVYYLAAYMGVSIGQTCIMVPCGALVAELTTTYDERSTMGGLRAIGGSFLGTVAAIVHGVITNDQSVASYRISAFVFGPLIWGLIWMLFAVIREKPVSHSKGATQQAILKDLKEVIMQRAFLCVCLLHVLGPTAVILVQSNVFLFAKYVLENQDLILIMVPLVQVVSIVSLPFWMILSHKTSKRHVYFVGGALMATALLVLNAAGKSQIVSLVLVGIFAFGLLVVYMIPFAMLPDIIDADTRRTGRQRGGLFTSLCSISLKLSATVAMTITNVLLKEAGYVAPVSTCGGGDASAESDADLDQQPQGVLTWMRLLVGPIPAVFLIMGMVMAWLSPSKSQLFRSKMQSSTDSDDGDTQLQESGSFPNIGLVQMPYTSCIQTCTKRELGETGIVSV